jgi:drug/metabolite transporter (DMT)-like permease
VLVIALSIAATLAGALGTFMTKSISLRMPTWQAVGPLFAINAILVLPLIGLGPAWHTLEPAILCLHLASTFLLCATTACIFTLITRGRASGVAVGQALAPAAALVAAPLLLHTTLRPLTVIAVLALMLGTLIPLRRSFVGIGSLGTVAILAVLGIGTGLLTVLTAMLAERGIGLPETYIVRAGLAAVVYLLIAPPRAVRPRDLPSLAVRSTFVTTSFLFTILAVQIGDVVVIQAILATVPLVIVGIEWLRHRDRPEPAIVTGGLVAAAGLALLLGLAAGT